MSTETGSRRAISKLRTRRRLLAALGEAVRVAGSGVVRVSDVIAQADVSHGTFYLHFSSLDEALAARLAEILDDAALAATVDSDLAGALVDYADAVWAQRDELRALSAVASSRRLRAPLGQSDGDASPWVRFLIRTAEVDPAAARSDQHYAAEMTAALIEQSVLRHAVEPLADPALLLNVLASIVQQSLAVINVARDDALPLLLPSSRRHHSFVAIDDRKQPRSDGDERIARARTFLAASGLSAGSRLCLLLDNGFAALELSAAAAQLGIVVVPTNTHWRPGEIEHVLRVAQIDALVFHDDHRSVVDALSPDLQRSLTLMAIGSAALEERYEIALSEHEPAPPHGGRDAHDTSSILFTSGSTTSSKGVLRTESTAERQRHAEFLLSLFGIGRGDVVLVAGPHHHSGNRAFILGANHIGASLVLMRTFDATRFLQLVQDQRVTFAFVVPTMLYRILELSEEVRRRSDLSSLRAVIHAASPCPPVLKRKALAEFGPIVWEYYGATELGGTVISSEQWLSHPGSVGRAWHPETAVQIFDDDGHPMPSEVVGNVGIRDPRRSPFEYLGSQHPPQFSDDGFFLTGDLGHLDKEGYLYLADRKRSVIKSGGVSVYPSEVEAVIRTFDEVEDCVVVGAADLEWGEAVVALVQARRTGRLDLDRLRAHVRKELAHYKCPRRWYVVDAIPRDGAGKLTRAEADTLLNRAISRQDVQP